VAVWGNPEEDGLPGGVLHVIRMIHRGVQRPRRMLMYYISHVRMGWAAQLSANVGTRFVPGVHLPKLGFSH
jgi:hypothetical protein